MKALTVRSCSVRFGEAEVVPRRRGSSREGRTNEPRARACAAEAVETRICGQRNPGNPENLLHRVRRSEGLCIRECRVLDYCEKEAWDLPSTSGRGGSTGGSGRLPLYPLWARSRRRGDNPRSPPRRKLLAQARRLRSFAERSELLSTSLVWYTLQHAHAAARHGPPESATGLHCHARP